MSVFDVVFVVAIVVPVVVVVALALRDSSRHVDELRRTKTLQEALDAHRAAVVQFTIVLRDVLTPALERAAAALARFANELERAGVLRKGERQ